MNEPRLVRFVTKHLDIGLSSITPAQQDRLLKARALALGRQKQGSTLIERLLRNFRPDLLTQRALARTAAAVLIVGVMSFWHAERYVLETAELDGAILTDEVPMDVLTDKGFDQWLKSSGAY